MICAILQVTRPKDCYPNAITLLLGLSDEQSWTGTWWESEAAGHQAGNGRVQSLFLLPGSDLHKGKVRLPEIDLPARPKREILPRVLDVCRSEPSVDHAIDTSQREAG